MTTVCLSQHIDGGISLMGEDVNGKAVMMRFSVYEAENIGVLLQHYAKEDMKNHDLGLDELSYMDREEAVTANY